MPPNEHADPDILIESIVAVTEQRDQLSVELSLCASLHEMLQPASLAVIELLPDARHKVTPAFAQSAEVPEAVLAEVRGMTPHEFHSVRTAGLSYVLASLEATGDGVQRLLAVGLPGDWDEAAERLMVGMVRVYQNFVRLMQDSEQDTLTGLHNRRKLERQLTALLASRLGGRRRADDEGDVYVAVLDLDKFKRVNDTYGHLIGDEVLLTFANLLRLSLRDHDFCYRYGGEEFIVILQKVDDAQAAMVFDRLRTRIEAHAFPQVGQVTVSVGYTRIDKQGLPTQIIEEADKALYYAKEHGRNQVRDYRALAEAQAVDTTRVQGSIELF